MTLGWISPLGGYSELHIYFLHLNIVKNPFIFLFGYFNNAFMINLLLHNRMQNHMVFLRMRTFLAVRAWISSFPSTLDHHFRNNLISLLSSKSHYSSLQIQWEPIPLLLIHDNDVLELILERIEVMSTSLKKMT